MAEVQQAHLLVDVEDGDIRGHLAALQAASQLPTSFMGIVYQQLRGGQPSDLTVRDRPCCAGPVSWQVTDLVKRISAADVPLNM